MPEYIITDKQRERETDKLETDRQTKALREIAEVGPLMRLVGAHNLVTIICIQCNRRTDLNKRKTDRHGA